MSRINDLKSQIQHLQQENSASEARIRGLVAHGRRNQQKLDAYFSPILGDNQTILERILESKPAHQISGWQSERWNSWDANQAAQVVKLPGEKLIAQLRRLRIGDWVEQRVKLQGHSIPRVGEIVAQQQTLAGARADIIAALATRVTGMQPRKQTYSDRKFAIPAYVPFIGCNKTIIIRTKGASTAKRGEELLQSLVIRTALMLPHQTAYVLLDPAGSGRAFPMQRYLPMVQENSGDVRRDLDKVLQDIQRIYATYRDASTPSFELVNPEIRINERFRFVFAANFPYHYDRRAIEALQDVSRNGPEAGTYLFIHYNMDHELPRDINMAEFHNVFYVDLDSNSRLTSCNLQIVPDAGNAAASPTRQNDVFERLRRAKPPEREILFDEHVAVPQEKWWTYSATSMLKTPIGASGARDSLEIWFGENENGRPCVHGMLGAMTGAGKSNLYHVMILGLCTRYSPDELQLYLIDGKDGVEFQIYRDLPHARVVSLRSSPALSRSVLAELLDEQERRNSLFTEYGVKDFPGYRTYCKSHTRDTQPPKNLPRILLMIDEYQELFEGDTDSVASNYLRQLAQQGRSAGIHMLLGSQRFGAVGMLNQTDIFGNIHLRMAMQMTNSDVQALTEFGRRGKQLITTCDLPGKIVVNDRSGDDDGNRAGKVAFFSKKEGEPDRREELIQQLAKLAEQSLKPDTSSMSSRRTLSHVPTTIVFDGKEQPRFEENPYIEEMLESARKTWRTTKEMEEFARRPVHENGLGISGWFAAEQPRVMWFGQDFTVLGQATTVVRRATGEHVLIIGGANAPRYGMLAASVVSLALTTPPSEAKFAFLDRSVPGTEWHDTLSDVVKCVLVPAGHEAWFYQDKKDTETLLNRLLEILDHRHGLPEASLMHEPSIFVVMTELDRVDDLRRRADTYGMADSPLGEKLQRLYMEGSPLGIHTILSFTGTRPMLHVIDERRGLPHFRHRVALQMSEDESLTLVYSRKAAQLQLEGPKPACALYMDVEQDRNLRFKPYSIETQDFIPQLQRVGEHLKQWSQKP